MLLTTHYLEEAEALCGRIAMLKQGRVVALDTTARAAQQALREPTLQLQTDRRRAARALARAGARRPAAAVRLACAAATRSSRCWPGCASAACAVEDIEIGQADLEDVFLDVMQGRQAIGRRRA